MWLVGVLVLSSGFAVLAQRPRPVENPLASRIDAHATKVRMVVLTDIANEPDDQMSLVRLLVYGNHFDIEGLVATTSVWLRKGVRPDVLHTVLDAYAQVQPNLLRHASGFPPADDLKRLVADGQPGYGMAATGADKTSPGAALLLAAMKRDDPRPLWVTAWGGTNTLAQALIDARAQRTPEQFAHSCRGCVSTPFRIRTMPERGCGANFRTAFHRHPVHAGRPGVFGGHMDRHQRRSVLPQRARRRLPHVHRRVAGRQHPGARAARHALSLSLLHPRGRYTGVPGADRQRPRECDEPDVRRLGRPLRLATAEGEPRAFWTQGGDAYPGSDSSRDTVRGMDGQLYTTDQATIWRWREAFQHDFAARMAWTVLPRDAANHNPEVVVNGAARHSAAVDRRAGRHPYRRSTRRDPRSRWPPADLPLVVLSRSRHRHSGASRLTAPGGPPPGSTNASPPAARGEREPPRVRRRAGRHVTRYGHATAARRGPRDPRGD